MRGPSAICIEVVTRCNATCLYCPLGREVALPSRYLSLDLLDFIIDNIPGEWRPRIELGGFGESLLHKGLPSLVKTIKTKRKELIVSTSTNGILLSPELLIALDRNGLDELTISINSVEKEYVRYRTPAQMISPLLETLRSTRKFLHNLQISIQLFAYKTREEIVLAETLAQYADKIYVKKVSNWNSLIQNPPELLANESGVNNYYECEWSQNAIMLDAKGYYSPCCVHLYSQQRSVSIYELNLQTYYHMLLNRRAELIFPGISTWCNKCTNGRNQYFSNHFEVL